MNKSIVHIFNDDKFVDSAISIMETTFPNQSDYFVIKNHSENYKYVQSKRVKKLSLQKSEDFIMFVDGITENSTQVVFFHALDPIKQKIMLFLPNFIVKVWLIWGYDLYNNWQLFEGIHFEKITREFISQKKKPFKYFLVNNNFTFYIFHKVYDKKLWLPHIITLRLRSAYESIFFRAIQKVDIVVPVLSNEYKYVKKLKINPTLGTFSYGTIEDLLIDSSNKNVLTKRNILIGNSAAPTNNHLDIFHKIKDFEFEDRLLYVPLSYGGSPEYIQKVITTGKHFFGDSFVPLLDFMSLERYNDILLTCGFVIFNHSRQQGVGNVVSMGFLGAKIFLNGKSSTYQFFLDKGMFVYSTNCLSRYSLSNNLEVGQMNRNREVLKAEYSRMAVKAKVNNLMRLVNEKLGKNYFQTKFSV